jgi:polyhydroxyalkanoic acid synthase PhaR subunit
MARGRGSFVTRGAERGAAVAEQKPEQRPSIPDPFSMWREWVSQSERQWNSFLNQVMGTDQYTQQMSQMMDTYLGMQKSFGEAMGRYLTTMNVATRTDVLSLGERLAAIEDRLRNIEMGARSPESRVATGVISAPSVPRPPRTKKPAKV